MSRILLIFSLWCLSVHDISGGNSLDFSNMGITTLRKPFINDKHLTDLNLSHNHIWNIQEHIFDDLPSLVSLNLSNNFFPFTHLKFKNTSLIEELDLDRAIITDWDEFDMAFFEEESLGEEYTRLQETEARHNVPFQITFTQDLTLPKMKRLYLRGNNITEINFAGVDSLDLLMPEITHLYLSNNKLESVDFTKIIPINLEELYLDNNELKNVDIDNLLNVRVLALDGNHIKKFCDINEECEGVTLKYAFGLEVLTMTNMGLQVITLDAFKFLVHLVELDMSSNEIMYFPEDAFSLLSDLKTLFIDNNYLEEVPNTKGLKNLENLSLANNLIKSFNDSSFSDDLTHLKRLNLSNNIITSIDSGSFDKLTSLEELDLSRNLINILPDNWISDKVNLQYLQINNNLFENFSSLALGSAKNLKYVSIGNNQFSTIDVGSLAELPKTAVIDFEDTSQS